MSDSVVSIGLDKPFAIVEDGKAFTVSQKFSNAVLHPYTDDFTIGHDENDNLIVSGIPVGWEIVNTLSNDPNGILESCHFVSEYTMAGLFENDSHNIFMFVVPRDGDLGSGNFWDTCDCSEGACQCDPLTDHWAVLRFVGV